MASSHIPLPDKPDRVFDRDAEWRELVAFACDSRPEARLGVVSGRLRQGKTYLLEALTGTLAGFRFGAQRGTEPESLNHLAAEFARYTNASAPPRWHGWEDAVNDLLALGDHRPTPIVIDEFPDLVRQSPSLPSVLHSAYRRHDGGRPGQARLLLSGSSLPLMRRLFSTASPLHELSDLHLTVRPLDYRQAARFWNIDDPALALLVHAVVGGSPAYRRDYVQNDAPADGKDFDAWVCRSVLNPGKPLFREAYHLLHDEIDHRDLALCHSALAAVATGCSTQGQVADCLGAPLTDTAHCLGLLREHGLLHSEADAFRPHLIRLRVAEPLLAFEHAAVRPHRSALEQQDPVTVWKRARPVFDSMVVRSHFAQVCRDWVLRFAGPDVFGTGPGSAAHGSLTAPSHPGGADMAADVVVRGHGGVRDGALLSVGLARWDEVMDLDHLERVRGLLGSLADRGEDVGRTRPACYSGAGFSPALRAAEAQGQVVLVGLDRLYGRT
ncbi:ATP-binding protein [Streptomyces sp. NK08204]|uniref:AAA family ATPase n=1 Tax=Streptomyces sp. NK08204 TaxID=2873260 RepID=UPI001CECC1F1|nr:ArsR family transcriptional regulator [Streptomyces sp. NK08204]